MRLWHYKLIPVLPRMQLLGQWRELCAISKMIALEKTPGHSLVNKVVQYPAWMLMSYQYMVEMEMKKRGYHIYPPSLFSLNDNTMLAEEEGYFADDDLYDYGDFAFDPFPEWHNDRYLLQCYFNLEEKYDCGMIPEKEWTPIEEFMLKQNLFI